MKNEDPLLENAKQRAGTGREHSEHSDSAVVQDARARTGAEIEDEGNPLLENAKQRKEARNG